MSTPGAMKGVMGITTQVLDVVETADRSGRVSFFRLCIGYFFKTILVFVCLVHMHVFFLLWLLPFYVRMCLGYGTNTTPCFRWYGRITSALAYAAIPLTIILLSALYLVTTEDWGWTSTGVGWVTWGLCVAILYFVDAYDKKVKIDLFSLRVYGVSRKLLQQKVRNDNESLQFLWICALVSMGPMLVIGWITDYIYVEFFDNASWVMSCGKKEEGESYTFCGTAQELPDICCKLKYSHGYPSYLDVIIRVATTFLISWGLVKFVAEWILTSENKVNELKERNLNVSITDLQKLIELQQTEQKAKDDAIANANKQVFAAAGITVAATATTTTTTTTTTNTNNANNANNANNTIDNKNKVHNKEKDHDALVPVTETEEKVIETVKDKLEVMTQVPLPGPDDEEEFEE